jgi:hypothetical protein
LSCGFDARVASKKARASALAFLHSGRGCRESRRFAAIFAERARIPRRAFALAVFNPLGRG